MKKRLVLICACAIFINFGTDCSAARQPIPSPESGLDVEDLRPGSGATATVGTIVTIHFTGWINEGGKKGIEFISTYKLGKPMSFRLGTDYVMKALNEGVRGMQIGGKRRLVVPAKWGYGSEGIGGVVPPNADLIFDVELIDVR
jgi:FKBP-type peptidyl-prolyl cis-trans isomerase